VVPIGVTLGGKPFDERVASLDDFYDELRGGVTATTSLPSPADFDDAYQRAAELGAEAVLSIHLDARASGTIAAAELAARHAAVPVTVVDTWTASFGVGLCVCAAADVIGAGGSPDDAARAAAQLGASLRNVFVARFAPGGRVPTTGSWMALSFRDGASFPLAECSSADEAVAILAACVDQAEGRVAASVGHAARELEPAADDLARALEDGGCPVERYRVGAAVGAHTGPDSFGAFWWPASATRP